MTDAPFRFQASVVIDVGCARYGDDFSIERLADMYRPHLIVGLDPAAEASALMLERVWPCRVVTRQAAAWVTDGKVRYDDGGLRGRTGVGERVVEAVGLPRLVREVHWLLGPPVVLKIDAEGAEYQLLRALLDAGVDDLLAETLVEWHPDGEPTDRTRAVIEERWSTRLEVWPW